MNYRHTYHAGNFGDVFKHALLVPLIRGMQRKDKGFLYLDTHAGLGSYDLGSIPAHRTLEYLDGIARLWTTPPETLPAHLRDYIEMVRRFNRERGGTDAAPRFYPGSPRLASMLLRPQDRLAMSELHPDDIEVLREEFKSERGVGIQKIDAYSALRAWLPPPEWRALTLIDPPYENPNESARMHEGLEQVLARFPSGTYVVWYPIKETSGSSAFKAVLRTLALPPTFAAELIIYDATEPGRLNGCGMLVLNPPWQIADEIMPVLNALKDVLAVEPGARATLEWLREED